MHIQLLYDVVMVAGMLLSLLAGQTGSITIEANARPVAEVLELIEAQVGLRLSAVGPIAREPLIVKVQKVPTNSFLTKLAAVVGAEWQKKPSGELVLDRTQAVEARLLKRHRETEGENWRRAIDQYLKVTGVDKPFTAAQAESSITSIKRRQGPGGWSTARQLPHARAIARLMASIDPEALSEVSPYGRLVISTAPTRMQVPAGRSAFEAIRLVNSEHQVMIDASQKFGAPPIMETGLISSMWVAQDLPQPVTQMALDVSLPWGPDTARLHLLCVDKSGSVVYGGMDDLQLTSGKVDGPPQIVDFRLQTSDRGRAILDALKAAALPKPLSLFKDVDKEDPLAFFVGDALLKIAERERRQLLAVVPDQMFERSIRCDTSQKLFQELAYSDCSIDKSSEWLVIQPKDPHQSLRLRLDRKAMSEYCASAIEHGRITLQSRVQLAQRYPFPSSMSMLSIWQQMLPTRVSGVGQEPPAILRFLGGLTQGQRSALDRQMEITVTQLTPISSSALEEWLYRTPFTTLLIAEQSGGQIVFSTQEWRSMPTVAFPHGVPKDLTIFGMTNRQETAFGVDPRYHSMRPMNASNVALQIDLTERSKPSDDHLVFTRFMPANELVISLRFGLGDLLTSAQLQDYEIAPDAKVGGLEVFSDSFKKAVQDALEKRRSQPPLEPPKRNIPPY